MAYPFDGIGMESLEDFEGLATWITKSPPDGIGLESLEDLAYLFDAAEYEEQSRTLLERNEKYREDGRALSRLRTAWQAAKKSVQLDHSVPRKTGRKANRKTLSQKGTRRALLPGGTHSTR